MNVSRSSRGVSPKFILVVLAALPVACSGLRGDDVDERGATAVRAALSAGPSTEEDSRVQAFIEGRYRASDVRHSFTTALGDTIDCIDFFAQPGVKALAAEGTPLTEIPPPPPLPANVASRTGSSAWTFDGAPDESGAARACPRGTVPERRVTAAQIQAAGGLDAYQRRHGTHVPAAATSSPSSPSAGPVLAPPGFCTQQFGRDYPQYSHVQETFNNSNVKNITFGEATLSINSTLVPPGSHHIAQTWTYSGWGANVSGCSCTMPPGTPTAQSPECYETVEVGALNSEGNGTSQFIVYSTRDGYATACYAGEACSTGYSWIQVSTTMTPGMTLPSSVVGGTQHELATQTAWTSGPTGHLAWWVLAQLDGGVGAWVGYWVPSQFTGAMASGTAQTFQAGGEVQDTTSTGVVQMGFGSSSPMGFQQAAYVHDSTACTTSGSCISTPTSIQVTGLTGNYNHWSTTAGSSSWSNWFYYGDTPNVFWGQNYGFLQWAPPSIGDWANGSYKGECGLSTSSGEPVAGVTSYQTGAHQAHAVLCGDTSFSVTPSSCYARVFDPGDNRGSTGDWDPGFYKADCRNNEYVSGVAQNGSGKMSTILCCPSTVSHASCNTQIFYQQNSPAFTSSGSGDFDWGYGKGVCPTGQYVAGISAIATGSTTGAPHAILCCQP